MPLIPTADTNPGTAEWREASEVLGVSGGARRLLVPFTNDDLFAGTFNVQHNWDTLAVLVQLFNEFGESVPFTSLTIVDSNTVNIDVFGVAPISGTWQAVIVG